MENALAYYIWFSQIQSHIHVCICKAIATCKHKTSWVSRYSNRAVTAIFLFLICKVTALLEYIDVFPQILLAVFDVLILHKFSCDTERKRVSFEQLF